MKSTTLAAAAMLAVAATGSAHAGQEPYGPGFAGWSFTQEAEKGGTVNCRALMKQGGTLIIMAMRSNGEGYMSVSAKGIKGTFPRSRLNLSDGPVEVLAKVYGDRLVFSPMDDWTMDKIASEGGFVWAIPALSKGDEVDLGSRATDALNRVFECINANS